MKDFLDKLREDAVYIKLKSDNKFGGAIDIESLIKTLKSLSQSYKNFLDVELRRSGEIKTTTKNSKKELNDFISDSELLIVDLDFASFGASIAPNTATSNQYFSIKDSLSLKSKAFKEYRKDVLELNYNDLSVLKRISDKYSDDERREIYKPIIDNLINSKKYKFYYGTDKDHLKPYTSSLSTKTLEQFAPKQQVEMGNKDEELFVIYVASSDKVDLFGKAPKISKVLAKTKMDKPVYPFQINRLSMDDMHIEFKDTLSAEVVFEDDLFFISYPDLNIKVWGDDRLEAEQAFIFALKSSLKNIYYSKNAELTKKAIQIKNRFNSMIKSNS